MPNAERIQNVLAGVSELPPDQRAAYLDAACRGDAALRAEVESLLKSHDAAGRFLAEPTVGPTPSSTIPTLVGAATKSGPAQEGPGTRIGPYKILQQIGEGGFGSVFMAEQESPVRRRVALKIIKLGMDTRQVVARFEQERQALAILDHPNIAKVFDAGATDAGRPYFVMELCTGEPIDTYCDRHNLSIPERLELFAQICQAVQHAHTKGIIHRDIKPGNILVSTQDGRPAAKVIDFGIAKATSARLTEKTLFTEHRQIIGTPEYMSPEQAEGSLDLDTRTDIYALGVLLYELLTGSTPFTSNELRSAAYAEIQRIIREVDPVKPSTRLSQNAGTLASVAARRKTEPNRLGALVRGELDWIVMKALEKDRQRRYESASAFASDIQRYLTREPVSAAPPSAGYKFRKFVQRNRGKVIAAGLLAAALVLGVIGTSAGMVWALKEKSRADGETQRAVLAAAAESKAKEEAQRRLTQVEKASDILSSIFESIDPREIARSGRPLQAVLVDNLDKAVTDLKGEAIGDSKAVLSVQMKLGKSLLSLGEASKAIVVLENARKTSADLFGPDDPLTLACTNNLAMAYGAAGKFDLAIPMLQDLVARTSAQPTGDAPALNMHNLGLLLRQSGKAADALPLFEKAAAARKARLGPDHPYTLSTLNALAATYSDLGKLDLAIPLLEETVAAYRKTLGDEHPSSLAAMNNLGLAYSGVGDAGKALPLLEEVVRVSKAKLGASNPNTLAAMTSLGHAYQSAGKHENAAAILEESLSLMRTRHGNDYPNTMATMTNLASTYWSLGKLDKSIPLYEEAVALYEHNYGRTRSETRLAIANLGVNYKDAGRFAEALPLLEEAYGASKQDSHLAFTGPALAETYLRLGKREQAAPIIAAAVAEIRAKQPAKSAGLAAGLATWGKVLLAAGDGDGAEPLIREALSIREEVQPDDWSTFSCRSMLGEALVIQKKYDGAEPLLLQGYEGLKARESKIPKGAGLRVAEALDRLVALYSAIDKPDEAGKWREERAKYPSAKSAEQK